MERTVLMMSSAAALSSLHCDWNQGEQSGLKRGSGTGILLMFCRANPESLSHDQNSLRLGIRGDFGFGLQTAAKGSAGIAHQCRARRILRGQGF